MSHELIDNNTVICDTKKSIADNTLNVIDMGYIDSSQAVFTETEGKILSLKLLEKEYPRVVLHRSFPHSHKTLFISVRDIENKEIGIIRDTSELDEKTHQLFERHLSIRYFSPNITKINSVKEEFGYCFWDTETTQGSCRFVVRRDSKNILPLANFEVLVIDIDGNRFVIPDTRALSKKETKMIELFV